VPVDPALAHSLLVERIRSTDLAGLHHTTGDIVQVHTIASIMEGRYDGEITVGELRGKGSWGIGTLQGLDGEVVVVDGEIWNIGPDGVAHVPPDDTLVPFAVLVEMDDPITFALEGPLRRDAFEAEVHTRLPDPDGCWAVRAVGRFRTTRFRSVARQHPPYRPLAEVLRTDQTFLEGADLEATVVGFCFPDWAADVELPGFHLHMLTADHATGGHVHDFDAAHLDVTVSRCRSMHLELAPGTEALATDPSAFVTDA
jgi:acetolactate decarboxylase